MNDKFFSLPEEKQLAIINAGYRVFSQNSYKKSPMSEIAAEAGISKSLLFHYFKTSVNFIFSLSITALRTHISTSTISAALKKKTSLKSCTEV